MIADEFFRNARHDLTGPLQGVRVVEATTTWAGPMCGCIFADLGADVIKVEMPEGEVARRVVPMLPGTNPPLSFMNETGNRNKRSVTLDLRKPEGAALFRKLAQTADVVVENFRPGTMHAWELGYEHLSALKSDLVYVSISGFGQYGPESDRAGYDPMAQAASGWLSLNGDPDGEPVKAPTYLGDDLAGLHSAIAALAALRHRDQHGEGQYIDVALVDALMFQSNGYPTLASMGVPLPRMGSQFFIAAPAGIFRTADGHVMAGVLLDAHWKILARVIGRPDLAEDPDYATVAQRIAHRAEVNAMMSEYLTPRTTDEVVKTFLRQRLPISPVRTFAEAAADPQAAERQTLQPTTLADGSEVPLVGPPAKFSRTPVRVRHAAPALGAHDDEVLEELGVDATERARLRKDGVIRRGSA